MDERRDILRRVADGTLTPAEAAVLLSQVGRGEAPPPPGDRVRRVRVAGQFGTARVLGDPSVREAVAEGPHRARREGDELIIESELPDELATHFSFSRSDRPWKAFARGAKHVPLTVRMHPDLPLDVDLAAGTLSVRGVRGPITADVSAGTVRIDGFQRPIDVTVASGTVRLTGVLSDGDSRVRCEAGTVRVHLDRGSSVRVRARAGLGKVVIPDDQAYDRSGPRSWLVGGAREAVVGDGEGTLDVEASMGTVHVSAD